MSSKPHDMRPRGENIRYASEDPADPVHQDEQGWWFWQETWADRCGPFESEQETHEELAAYARTL